MLPTDPSGRRPAVRRKPLNIYNACKSTGPLELTGIYTMGLFRIPSLASFAGPLLTGQSWTRSPEPKPYLCSSSKRSFVPRGSEGPGHVDAADCRPSTSGAVRGLTHRSHEAPRHCTPTDPECWRRPQNDDAGVVVQTPTSPVSRKTD